MPSSLNSVYAHPHCRLIHQQWGVTIALSETWNIGTFSISFTKSTMLVVAICGRGYNKSPLNVEFTDKNHAEFSINDEYGKPSIIYLSLGK